jgi:hypothetical protein
MIFTWSRSLFIWNAEQTGQASIHSSGTVKVELVSTSGATKWITADQSTARQDVNESLSARTCCRR